MIIIIANYKLSTNIRIRPINLHLIAKNSGTNHIKKIYKSS